MNIPNFPHPKARNNWSELKNREGMQMTIRFKKRNGKDSVLMCTFSEDLKPDREMSFDPVEKNLVLVKLKYATCWVPLDTIYSIKCDEYDGAGWYSEGAKKKREEARMKSEERQRKYIGRKVEPLKSEPYRPPPLDDMNAYKVSFYGGVFKGSIEIYATSSSNAKITAGQINKLTNGAVWDFNVKDLGPASERRSRSIRDISPLHTKTKGEHLRDIKTIDDIV